MQCTVVRPVATSGRKSYEFVSIFVFTIVAIASDPFLLPADKWNKFILLAA